MTEIDDVVVGGVRGVQTGETVSGMWRRIEMGHVHRAASSHIFLLCIL